MRDGLTLLLSKITDFSHRRRLALLLRIPEQFLPRNNRGIVGVEECLSRVHPRSNFFNLRDDNSTKTRLSKPLNIIRKGYCSRYRCITEVNFVVTLVKPMDVIFLEQNCHCYIRVYSTSRYIEPRGSLQPSMGALCNVT